MKFQRRNERRVKSTEVIGAPEDQPPYIDINAELEANMDSIMKHLHDALKDEDPVIFLNQAPLLRFISSEALDRLDIPEEYWQRLESKLEKMRSDKEYLGLVQHAASVLFLNPEWKAHVPLDGEALRSAIEDDINNENLGNYLITTTLCRMYAPANIPAGHASRVEEIGEELLKYVEKDPSEAAGAYIALRMFLPELEDQAKLSAEVVDALLQEYQTAKDEKNIDRMLSGLAVLSVVTAKRVRIDEDFHLTVERAEPPMSEGQPLPERSQV